jgi:hypothetical protein
MRTHFPRSDMKALPRQLLLRALWLLCAYTGTHLQKVILGRVGYEVVERMEQAVEHVLGYGT